MYGYCKKSHGGNCITFIWWQYVCIVTSHTQSYECILNCVCVCVCVCVRSLLLISRRKWSSDELMICLCLCYLCMIEVDIMCVKRVCVYARLPSWGNLELILMWGRKWSIDELMICLTPSVICRWLCGHYVCEECVCAHQRSSYCSYMHDNVLWPLLPGM